MSRECRCSCDLFGLAIRVLTFLAHAGTGACAGFGFIVAAWRFNQEQLALSADVAKAVTSLNSSLAVFQGLMAFYYCVRARRGGGAGGLMA